MGVIKLKRLISEWGDKERPDQSFDQLLRAERVVDFGDYVYHGSPLIGLKGMLEEGIYGQEHNEVAEYNAFSTSPNSGVLHYFSEGDGDTGLCFKIESAKVLVLDEYLTKLVTELPGSGMSAEVEDEEAFETFCLQYKMPRRKHDGDFYLPYGYIESLGVDAFMYDYAYSMYKRGNIRYNDECEVCFVGSAIDKLGRHIHQMWVDGNDYDGDDVVAAVRAINEKLEGTDDQT